MLLWSPLTILKTRAGRFLTSSDLRYHLFSIPHASPVPPELNSCDKTLAPPPPPLPPGLDALLCFVYIFLNVCATRSAGPE